MKDKRNSKVEMMRLVLMYGIVLCHFCVHGILSQEIKFSFSLNYIVCNFMGILGPIGNNVFMLLSGFFMVKSRPSINKIRRLHAEVLFYSWFFIVIGAMLHLLTVKNTIKAFFPVFFGENWYVSTYIMFSFFIPYVNMLIEHTTKKGHQVLIMLLLLVYCIIPSFGGETYFETYFSGFFTMYVIGAYFKIYGFEKIKGKIIRVVLVAAFSLKLFIIAVLAYLNCNYNSEVYRKLLLGTRSNNSILIVIISSAILIIGLSGKESYDKISSIINGISPSVLAVYLIHDNEIGRILIWRLIIPNVELYFTRYFICFMFIKSIIVFGVCLAFDIGKRLIERRIVLRLSLLNKGLYKKELNVFHYDRNDLFSN